MYPIVHDDLSHGRMVTGRDGHHVMPGCCEDAHVKSGHACYVSPVRVWMHDYGYDYWVV